MSNVINSNTVKTVAIAVAAAYTGGAAAGALGFAAGTAGYAAVAAGVGLATSAVVGATLFKAPSPKPVEQAGQIPSYDPLIPNSFASSDAGSAMAAAARGAQINSASNVEP